MEQDEIRCLDCGVVLAIGSPGFAPWGDPFAMAPACVVKHRIQRVRVFQFTTNGANEITTPWIDSQTGKAADFSKASAGQGCWMPVNHCHRCSRALEDHRLSPAGERICG